MLIILGKVSQLMKKSSNILVKKSGVQLSLQTLKQQIKMNFLKMKKQYLL